MIVNPCSIANKGLISPFDYQRPVILLEEATIPGIETHLPKQSSRLHRIIHPKPSLCCNNEGTIRGLIPVEDWNEIKYVAGETETIRIKRRPRLSFTSEVLARPMINGLHVTVCFLTVLSRMRSKLKVS